MLWLINGQYETRTTLRHKTTGKRLHDRAEMFGFSLCCTTMKKPTKEQIKSVMSYVGSHTSEKKSKSSRENGKKGGRKRKCRINCNDNGNCTFADCKFHPTA